MKPDLRAIRELLAKATPGPWFKGTATTVEKQFAGIDNALNIARCNDYSSTRAQASANADLIGQAPMLLAALADRCEVLELALEKIRDHWAQGSDAVSMQSIACEALERDS